MRYIFFILIISFAYFQMHAQTPHDSPGGKFHVDNYQGCAPLAVTVSTSICSGATGCTLLKDYYKSTGIWKATKVVQNTAADSFVFYSPGIHRITLITTNVSDSSSVEIIVFPNTAPAFNIYSCNGDKALLNILDINFDNYKIQYPPATNVLLPKGSPPAIISLPAGSNNVKVTGDNIDADNSQCLTNTQTVFAQAALDAPIIDQLTVVSDKEIDLTFPLASDHHQDYTQYQLDINTSGGAFTPLLNSYNQSSATITGISADNNYYCFRLTPFDKCTQTRSAQQSNTICSIRFRAQDIVVGNKKNDLTWLTAQPDANFTIKRTPDVDDGSVAQTYQHNPVECGTVYTYQIISNYSVGINGAKSYSEIRQATGNSTDPAADINNLSVSLNEDATIATLLWDAGIQAKEYSIFRNQNLLKTTESTSITDDKYTINDCYEVSYKDNCGNNSSKIEACPIILEYTLRDDNTIDLLWNNYDGWKNNVSAYQLLIYSTNGDIIGTVSGPGTSYSDTNDDGQVVIYRVVGKPNDLVPDVLSNLVTVIKSPHIYYPTAFSPGSSTEVNQKFNVFGKYIESFEMQVFNRWGEMIFATKDKDEGWDGTYLGLPVPAGVYAFIARITDTAGQKITKSGSVALIRKK